MKRTIPALLLLVAIAPGLVVGAAALPPQVTCFGQVATVPGATSGDDILYGTPGDDVIRGLGGNDVLYGLGGRDRICGGDGNDRIYGGPGGDFLDGEAGLDLVSGQGGNDVLSPGAGNIAETATVEGGKGRDRIVISQPGYTEVFGGAGRDTIDFRKAPVGMLIDLRYTAEYLDGSGVPTIGGKAFEVEDIYGTPFDDSISGNARSNRLFGFAGDDIIHGRGGNDYLNAGLGLGDWFEGNNGTDTCVDPDGFIVGDECEIWP
jgi:Ca2+-binding RTX toxin-like protein